MAGPLLADPNAAAVFGRGGVPIAEGQRLVQPDLAATLSQIRTAGVGDFFQGGLAGRIAQASVLVGGPVTVADLRAALPSATPGLVTSAGHDQVAFLPPPADGGLAAAAAFRVLQANPSDVQTANARALAVAARWRSGHEDPEVLLRGSDVSSAGLPALPASTSFVTLDRDGNAVVCALSMDNLFGTGRILPGLGFLLAASPVAVPPPCTPPRWPGTRRSTRFVLVSVARVRRGRRWRWRWRCRMRCAAGRRCRLRCPSLGARR